MSLQEKTKELEKKVKILKTEKIETSSNYNKIMSMTTETDRVVRTQIPMMAGMFRWRFLSVFSFTF